MIKEILDEITAISGTNDKIKALSQHSDNAMLKVVLYRAHSKRVKFYLRQIPEYTPSEGKLCHDIGWALRRLEDLQNRIYSGNEATAWLKETLESISSDDAKVIELIIGKSTKMGIGTTIMNKVFKNLIEKTPYQGAKQIGRAHV